MADERITTVEEPRVETTDEDFGRAPKRARVYFSYQNKDGTWNTPRFDEDQALAALLMEEVVFLSGANSKNAQPSDLSWTVMLNCNDVFMWGCADCEPIGYHELQTVYDLWCKGGGNATDAWVCKRRNEKPQRPVEKSIREAGFWDDEMETLPPNQYDLWRKEEAEKRKAGA